MTSIIDHSDGKKWPVIDDFTISNGDRDCFEINVDQMEFYLTKDLRFFGEQLRIPEWEYLGREDLIEKLRYRVIEFETRTIAENLGKEPENPVFICINSIRGNVKEIARTFNGALEGVMLVIKSGGIVLFMSEYHMGESVLDLQFAEDGKLKTRYREGISDLNTRETWDEKGKYEVVYRAGFRDISKEEYFRLRRRITQNVESATQLPRDITQGVFEKFI